MLFSLIRTDKKNAIHLSTKTAEAFIQRIQTDTQARDITRLREHLSRGNELRYYAPPPPPSHFQRQRAPRQGKVRGKS